MNEVVVPDHETTTTNGPVVPGRSALVVCTKRARLISK